jgi:intein-encoded DNA endonuclease-like protein
MNPDQTPQSTFDEKLRRIVEYAFYSGHANQTGIGQTTPNTVEQTMEEVTSLVLEEKVAELESIYHKHGRTYKQTVTDGEGNVYVEDSHRYISNYQMQERIATLRSQQRSIITKEKDND